MIAIMVAFRTTRQAKSQAPNGNWNPDNGQVRLNRDDADNRNDNLGVRLPMRGLLQVTDFNQPPSMRPISSSAACSCMTRVALTNLSSKYRRSFNRRVSS